jgi:hypothetical protein
MDEVHGDSEMGTLEIECMWECNAVCLDSAILNTIHSSYDGVSN